MMNWRKRLAPVLVAASLLLVFGTPTSAVSHAEEAVLVPGATVFKRINPLYPIVTKTYPKIGIHFHSDADPQVIQYSQNAFDSDRAIAEGVEQATTAVRQSSAPVVIIGESMGSMVAWRVAAELARSSDPPAREDVRVVLIAPPEVGAAEYFKQGTRIPMLNYRVTRIVRSPYDTTVVIGEYDGWADPPDRPWNLLAFANALAGIVYVHGPPIFTADVSGLAPVDYVAGDAQYGSVTTYLVPTPHLPLTQVFRDIGVRDEIVDKADQVLRPIIDAAYVRHDLPGDTRPYLSDGAIRRHAPSPPPARASAPTPELSSALRAAIRDDSRTQVKAVTSVRPAGAVRFSQFSGPGPQRDSAPSRRQP